MSRTAPAIARTTPTVDDLMNLAECSRLTNLTTRTISFYVSVGRIPSVKVGHGRVFDRHAIEAWLDVREQSRRQGHAAAEPVASAR
jgi:DNA-binding transcriptional MerR regulator